MCLSRRVFDTRTCITEILPVVTQVLQVEDTVLQKAGFIGNEEVQEDSVVEGETSE